MGERPRKRRGRRRRKPSLRQLTDTALQYSRRVGGHGTEYSYQRAVQRYLRWAASAGAKVRPATVETLGAYLVYLEQQGLSESTVRTALSALRAHYNAEEGLRNAAQDPRVMRIMRQVVRNVAQPIDRVRPIRAPMLVDLVRRAEAGELGLACAADPARWARDKALLLLGYAGAFRRSEIAGLDWEDVHWLPKGVETAEGLQGVELYIVRSKRDQFARGAWVGIPVGGQAATCPVRALWRWQAWVERVAGPVFVGMLGNTWSTSRASTQLVYQVVSRYARAMDWAGCTPHSLRAGWATDMLALGVASEVVQTHLRHRDRSQLRVYFRPGRVPDPSLLVRAGL